MRYSYFDFARGILMSLGVVIHSAQVYGLDSWRIHSPITSSFFDNVIELIHLFRMPAFYVISGFFVMMLIQRYPRKSFYGNRLVRLGVPLIFCGFFLNSFNHLLSYDNLSKGIHAFNLAYWLGGGWLGHLWFLGNLLIYIFILRELTGAFPVFVKSCKDLYLRPLYVYILIPVFIFLLLRLSWRLPSPPFGDAWIFISMGELFFYAPYFLLGAYFYLNQRSFDLFINSLGFSISGIILYFIFHKNSHETLLNEYISEILYTLSAISSVSLIFFIFKKYFNKDLKIIRELSDSSYTVYLVHPPILLLIASLLIKTNMNIYSQFLILSISVWVLSYLCHYLLVKKIKLVRFLLNGKYQ